MSALLEAERGDGVGETEERSVAVAKVETPYLDGLVSGATDEKLIVIGDIDAHNRKLRSRARGGSVGA